MRALSRVLAASIAAVVLCGDPLPQADGQGPAQAAQKTGKGKKKPKPHRPKKPKKGHHKKGKGKKKPSRHRRHKAPNAKPPAANSQRPG